MKAADKCVHFNGIQHERCDAGVVYADVRLTPESGPRRFPCLPPIGGAPTPDNCPSRRYPTEQEIAEDRAMWDAAFALISAGLSPCCEAPLDVPPSGHGWRYCSKCKKAVMHACGGGHP